MNTIGSAADVAFKSSPIQNGLTVTCDVCGAAVTDWAKNSQGWTTEHPNRDKHAAWHAALGA